jgi:hypothetical protein
MVPSDRDAFQDHFANYFQQSPRLQREYRSNTLSCAIWQIADTDVLVSVNDTTPVSAYLLLVWMRTSLTLVISYLESSHKSSVSLFHLSHCTFRAKMQIDNHLHHV